jgi:autotransporter passenger strand-loop-strand repeat protein
VNLVSGGVENVYSGGSDSDARVSGLQVVYGSATSATVYGNVGLQVVYGEADDTTVSSGGGQFVWGAVSGTIVESAAYETAVGTTTGTILNGGVANVLFGGVASFCRERQNSTAESAFPAFLGGKFCLPVPGAV